MNPLQNLVQQLAPHGVPYVQLSEVATYSTTRVDASELDETSYVGVDNLVANKRGRVDASYPPNTVRLTAYRPGDVLIGNIRPYLKKVWVATNYGGCSGDVLAVRINKTAQNSLTPDFLYYLLSSDKFFAYNMQHAKGAKMPRGNKVAILNYKIPLPALEIQREVVAILDRFTTLEAELEAELEARQQQYAYYRTALLSSFEANEMVALGDIAHFKYGYTTKATDSGDFRFLRITDITENGHLVPADPKFVEATSESEAYKVEPGDLLMARTGATFGKTLLVRPGQSPAVYASFLIRIRFKDGSVLPSYYWHFAQSELYWAQANSLVSSGSQPQFNANSLKKVKLRIPPLKEQRRVIGVLDKFDALVNDMTVGLPAEIKARRQQYEYYRDKLLTFQELEVPA